MTNEKSTMIKNCMYETEEKFSQFHIQYWRFSDEDWKILNMIEKRKVSKKYWFHPRNTLEAIELARQQGFESGLVKGSNEIHILADELREEGKKKERKRIIEMIENTYGHLKNLPKNDTHYMKGKQWAVIEILEKLKKAKP